MYFVANWKMFGDLRTLNSLDKVIKFSKTNKKNKFKIVYCPPNTLIRPLSRRLKKTKIEVGAQNCHENEKSGAFTGFINSMMLKDVGAKFVIIGHCENRKTGENNKLINLKIKSALKSGLKVIFCIGETLKEKRLISKSIKKVKIFGDTAIESKVTVEGIKVTKGARASIEKAGGKVEDSKSDVKDEKKQTKTEGNNS